MRPHRGLAPDRLAIDPSALEDGLRDALARFDDLPYLRVHPLMALLPEPDSAQAGKQLRELLVRSIERLRPLTPTADSAAWRRYRLLQLRHVDGLTPKAVADALGVSERHVHREHHEALAPLATVFLACLAELPNEQAAPPGQRHVPAGGFDSTNVAGTIEGVRETLRRLLDERGVTLEIASAPISARTSVTRVALRQVLLAIFVAGIDLGRRKLHLDVTEGAGRVRMAIRMRGGTANGLTEAAAFAQVLLHQHGGELRLHPVSSGDDILLDLPALPATVLLIDDDPDFGRLFRRVLAGTSYRVLSVARPREALDRAREELPDIIVLDVIMPAFDGWESLQALKADPATATIPILVCSVVREESLARALGAAGCLTKPVTPELLREALDGCRAAALRSAPPGTPASNASTPRTAVHPVG